MFWFALVHSPITDALDGRLWRLERFPGVISQEATIVDTSNSRLANLCTRGQLGSDRDLINFNFFLFFFLFSCCGLQEEARREGVVSLCCGRCNSALRMRRGRVVDAFCDESGTRSGRVGRRVVDALAMSEAGRVEDVSLTHRGHPPFSVDVSFF